MLPLRRTGWSCSGSLARVEGLGDSDVRTRLTTMAKRFKAAVIGGSGYGGAEIIRRLLPHPDVELARVAPVGFIGEPLRAPPPPTREGATPVGSKGLGPAEAAGGMDMVLLGFPQKVSAQKMPELMAT